MDSVGGGGQLLTEDLLKISNRMYNSNFWIKFIPLKDGVRIEA